MFWDAFKENFQISKWKKRTRKKTALNFRRILLKTFINMNSKISLLKQYVKMLKKQLY